MYSFSRALISAFFAWIAGVSVLVGVSALLGYGMPDVFEPFHPSAGPVSAGFSPLSGFPPGPTAGREAAHVARGFILMTFGISLIVSVGVIAPLLAQLPPSCWLWRARWLCPLAVCLSAAGACLAFLPLMGRGFTDYLPDFVPVLLGVITGTLVFTASYADLMDRWRKRVDATQPYVT